jgi:hypothetical protein
VHSLVCWARAAVVAAPHIDATERAALYADVGERLGLARIGALQILRRRSSDADSESLSHITHVRIANCRAARLM